MSQDDLFRVVFLRDVFFFGTFAPAFRASDKPMAIACLRLVTFLPLPLRNVPRFFSRITFSTFFDAFFEYFAITIVDYILTIYNFTSIRVKELPRHVC